MLTQIGYIHLIFVLQISFSPLFFPLFLHTADVSPAPPILLQLPPSHTHTHTLALAVPDVCRDDVMADRRHWTLILLFFLQTVSKFPENIVSFA